MKNREKLLTGLLVGITVLNLAVAGALIAVWREFRAATAAPEAAESAQDSTQPVQQTETLPEETAPAVQNPVSSKDIALYQAQCREIAYEDFARDSDAMKRQYFTFTGKIKQVMEDEGHYRLGVKNGSNYSDIVYLDYQRPEGSERVLEGDIVTVWGVSEGLYTYTSVSDEQITVPRLHVGYLERLTEEQIAALGRRRYARLECGNELHSDGFRVKLVRVLSREPDAEELQELETDGDVCIVWLLLEVFNESDETAVFTRYGTACFADGFRTEYTYAVSDTPDGYGSLGSEELEAGYGVRGNLHVIVPSDWETLELHLADGAAFTVRHEDLKE